MDDVGEFVIGTKWRIDGRVVRIESTLPRRVITSDSRVLRVAEIRERAERIE